MLMSDPPASVHGVSFASAFASCISPSGPFKLRGWIYGSEAGCPARSVIGIHARSS